MNYLLIIQVRPDGQVLTARRDQPQRKERKDLLSKSQQICQLLTYHHFQFATVLMEHPILTADQLVFSNILHKEMTKKTKHLNIQNLMVSTYQSFQNALE